MIEEPIIIGISCARSEDQDGFEFHGERTSLVAAVEFAARKASSRATALLLPLSWDRDVCRRRFDCCSAILLPGGVDLLPETYGENPSTSLRETDRIDDLTELAYARWAVREGKPILGICRGMHLLAVSCGASLVQDLREERGTSRHDYIGRKDWAFSIAHEIVIEGDSQLGQILDSGGEDLRFGVSSGHHQAVDELDHFPGQLHISARDPEDGVVEAIEVKRHPFAIGVQWHPEFDLERDVNSNLLRVFTALVEAATAYKDSLQAAEF